MNGRKKPTLDTAERLLSASGFEAEGSHPSVSLDRWRLALTEEAQWTPLAGRPQPSKAEPHMRWSAAVFNEV